MKSSPTSRLKFLCQRAVVALGAICLALLVDLSSLPAAQDCEEYFGETGAAGIQDFFQCRAVCTAGSKGMGNFTCGNRCAEFCQRPMPRLTIAPPELDGRQPREECNRQAEHYLEQAERNIDAWEQDIAEGKSSLLSEDDLAFLRLVADQFLSGFRGFLIERAGGASSLDVVFVNSGHIADIVNAESGEQRFLASLSLGFALLTSFIPQGGKPESAGIKIDEIGERLGEYITALKDLDSLRAFARKQYERKREACRQIPIQLDAYEAEN